MLGQPAALVLMQPAEPGATHTLSPGFPLSVHTTVVSVAHLSEHREAGGGAGTRTPTGQQGQSPSGLAMRTPQAGPGQRGLQPPDTHACLARRLSRRTCHGVPAPLPAFHMCRFPGNAAKHACVTFKSHTYSLRCNVCVHEVAAAQKLVAARCAACPAYNLAQTVTPRNLRFEERIEEGC